MRETNSAFDQKEKKQSPCNSIASAGFLLSSTAFLAAVLAGFGSQWGWWHFRAGFLILQISAWTGLLSAILCVAGISGKGKPGKIWAVIGLAVGLAIALVPWNWKKTAKSVPPIHDITTDTSRPPQFYVILPLRKNAPNPVVYGGAEIAKKQKSAYPDIEPVVLSVRKEDAFKKALQSVKKMKWRLVSANPAKGTIEALDRTFWFGFVDDVVVRVESHVKGSRIDIRSVSRVGKSDAGTNARRIRSYLRVLNSQGGQL